MNLKKPRIICITADSNLNLSSKFNGSQTVEVNKPEVLTKLAFRGADLIVLDLGLGKQLLDFSDVLASLYFVPLLTIGQETKMSQQLVSSARVEARIDANSPDEVIDLTAGKLIDKGRFLRGEKGLIGKSNTMQELRDRILTIAETPVSTVLLTGESGSGKDLVAHGLHDHSERSDFPFKAINCAAIPDNLLENELFGHEKGAYTDAKERYKGIFEQAHGGTVFLDEIGEMAIAAQVRLLRVLDERKVTRIGGSVAVPTNVRVIAATNRDLQEAVNQRTFRLDLYHRLKVVELNLPSLRRRTEDLPDLIEHFREQLNPKGKNRFERFSRASLTILSDYAWPGNVRELKNLMEHLVFLAPDPVVDPEELLPHLETPPIQHRNLPITTSKSPDQSERELIYFALLDLKREVAELRNTFDSYVKSSPEIKTENNQSQAVYPYNEETFIEESEDKTNKQQSFEPQAIEPLLSLKDMEHEAIIDVLNKVNNNRRKAADILGISARTLYRKLNEYGIE